jgi:hypothetical protein
MTDEGQDQGRETRLVPVDLPGAGQTYLDESMVPRVQRFIERAAEEGVDLHFNSAYRTPQHQAALRNDPNAITPATNSLHSAGFAVDVNFSTLPPEHREVILRAAQGAGLQWGGDFRRPDPPHFYVEPPIDRQRAIENATHDYNEMVNPEQSIDGNDPQARIDRRLIEDVRTSLAKAEQGIGKVWDDDSERMSASLYGAAREKGFSGTDELRVAFSESTDRSRAGELVFLQRTGVTASPDPYANRAHLATNQAIAQPVDQIMQQVQEREVARLDQEMGQQTQRQQLDQEQISHGPMRIG